MSHASSTGAKKSATMTDARSNATWSGGFARTALPVVAGFLITLILTLATDQLLHVLGVYPPWGQPMREPGLNALALAYRIVITVFGGWLTARLAPTRPMRHAM